VCAIRQLSAYDAASSTSCMQTGTLTRNVMEFFKCSIGGVAYGAGITEIERNNAER